MRFAAALALASASLVAAQTSSAAASSPTGGSCDAQNIVDACVDQYQKQVDACTGNDWICLCDNYTNLLTCYNNCPNSQSRPPVQNQVTQYCQAAAPLKSSSLAAAATMPKTSAASASATGSSATGSTAASAASATASAFATGAASPVTVPMGGAFAAVLALVGLL